MSLQDCIEEVRRASGVEMSDDDIKDLAADLADKISEREAVRAGENADDELMAAAEEFGADMVRGAKIAKRNFALNLQKELQILDYIENVWGDDKVKGLSAVLVGNNSGRPVSRNSAAAMQDAVLGGTFLSGMQNDIAAAGLQKIWASGVIEKDIARALWATNRRDPLPANVGADAIKMAEIISEYQEIARSKFNKAGGWQKRLEGYIVRQSHDQAKVRGRGDDASFKRWRDYILPRLDVDRTFKGADQEKFLKATWMALSSGVHLKAQAQPALKGAGNIARRGSAERVLHFKGADEWFDYNKEFGVGTLRDAVLRGFQINGRTIGLMQKMGTNPTQMLDNVVKKLIARSTDVGEQTALDLARRTTLKFQMATLDGTTQVPVNALQAKIMQDIRSSISMAKLGRALFSQIADIGFYGTEMQYQGRPVLSGVAEAMTNLGKGRPTEHRRQLRGMVGVWGRGFYGDVASRWSVAEDLVPGHLSKMQRIFFKWNGMNWWTDAQRTGSLEAMSWLMADNARLPWSRVNKDYQRVMTLFGIQEPEWNVIRHAEAFVDDGDRFLTPESIADVPREHLEAVLTGQGIKVTDRKIANLREEITDKIKAYLQDRTNFAVIEPGAREMAFMTRGTQPGTPEGDAFRFFFQLKAFPVTAAFKGLGRTVYGKGAKNIREAMFSGNGEMTAMVSLMTTNLIFGYIAMSSKDLLSGKLPRDPLHWKTFTAAFVQGGGAGIYGDFLFGEMRNRFGNNIATTFAGPGVGLLNTVFDLYGRMLAGDDLAASTFRALLVNTPFANLFYTRAALDYLILRDLQEAVNPGALRRVETRVRRENAQDYIRDGAPSEFRSRLIFDR